MSRCSTTIERGYFSARSWSGVRFSPRTVPTTRQPFFTNSSAIACPRPRDAPAMKMAGALISERHHGADRRAFVHQVEGLVDVSDRQRVRDERVDVDLLLHVPVDDLRHVGAASRAAERGAFPY